MYIYIYVGPDIAQQFLTNNNLKMIVRSHECVRSGFDRPFKDTANHEAEHMLCTIFSASNYSGGGNSAAYMTFTIQNSRRSRSIYNSLIYKVKDSDICYTVNYFHIDESDMPMSLPVQGFESGEIVSSKPDSFMLKDIILRKRQVIYIIY